MKHVLLPFCLLASLTAVLSQCNNPLLKSNTNPDGVQGLPTPQVVSGLKNCLSLEGKSSCCSADTINGFRATLSTNMDQIKARVGDSDLKLAKVIYDFSQVWVKSLDILSKYSSLATGSWRILQESFDVVGILKVSFYNISTARSNCFTHTFQIASKLLCMACISDTSAFIKDGKLKISNKTCTNLLNKCAQFIATIPVFAKYKTDEMKDALAAQISVLEKLTKLYDLIKSFQAKKNDPAVQSELAKDIEESTNEIQVFQETRKRTIASYQKPVPLDCEVNDKSCTLICDRIISDKGLNFTALETGAVDFETVKNASLFGDRRMLVVADDGFDVETQVNSGFESTLFFPVNPSNANLETGTVDLTGRSFSISLEISVVLLLSLMFFLF